MNFLYGHRRNGNTELVAKFGSEQQMLAYISYATLRTNEDGTMVFEQKTPLTGCVGYSVACEASEEDQAKDVPFNPTPTML
ncbi:hypothetical protein HG15A2_08350 [Adhaeretor mobilis]|uniref:Uncharacterized protein n=1 Tax=Adhaeretor mobilis TaxID=1930276 RepID=A0A517MRR2_9BACT|nr:hypothetical protein HG15A2_08350 [Adhaeretor mobilis]